MFVCWGIEGQDCIASKITGYMMCSIVIHAIESTHQRKLTGEANIVVVHVKY